MSQTIPTSLKEIKQLLFSSLPLNKSFDFITRDISIGNIDCYFLSLNGLCDLEIIQRLFSDMNSDLVQKASSINSNDLPAFLKSQFFYVQITFSHSFPEMIRQVLCGPSLLFLDGYEEGLIIDTRKYPARGIDQPDTEKVIRGAKDGFTESMLTNCNLIRRRLRTPSLVFSLHHVGSLSYSDVSLCYLSDRCDHLLLESLSRTIEQIRANSLTMGSMSLSELLVKKGPLHPLPSVFLTERPDVAASYLCEGYLLLLTDNSPFAMIFPCNIFQFTQSPEDYCKSPPAGTYYRLLRFVCTILSLLLLPLSLHFTFYPQWLPEVLNDLIPDSPSFLACFIFVLFVEIGLDLFNYASSHSSVHYSSALGIVGGLIIGDMAVKLSWVSSEILFYGALTLVASMAVPSVEFRDGIKMYRLFLILSIGLFPHFGLFAGLFLVIISLVTTPVYGTSSYLWPLFPFDLKALLRLLFRRSSFIVQPEHQKYPKQKTCRTPKKHSDK